MLLSQSQLHLEVLTEPWIMVTVTNVQYIKQGCVGLRDALNQKY